MPSFKEHQLSKSGVGYGCLFCKTGSEVEVAKELQSFDEIEALAPERKYRRRINGEMDIRSEILFPGYVFIKAPTNFDVGKLLRYSNTYRLLTTDKEWLLTGNDAGFVQWLFEQGTELGFSQAYFEGEKIRIVSGPLKDYEEAIIRVNKRFQNALVILSFNKLQIRVCLGYELVDGNT